MPIDSFLTLSHHADISKDATSSNRHKCSSSILSTVTIPSRSSSVIMPAAATIPSRSSSISSPINPGIPITASDLADTIAGLNMADDNQADTSTGTLGDATPKVASHPFSKPSNLLLRSPRLNDPPQGASGMVLGFGDARQETSLSEASEEIRDAILAIEDIRKHMFLIQEKRHAGSFTSASASAPSASASSLSSSDDKYNGTSTREAVSNKAFPATELDMALMQLDEKLEASSRTMQQLEVRIGEICSEDDEQDPDSSIVDKEMINWHKRNRRDSMGSMASLTSFDEMLLPSFAPSLSPKALKARYDELAEDWSKVQQECETLRKELGDDKYLIVFRSVSEQAESMMDSLDKAINHCHSFISDFQRDHKAGIIKPDSEADDDYFETENDPTTKLSQLADLKKTFTVKRSYYTPACEQVFNVLERGTRERGGSNGTILRKLADLKSRWKQLREMVSRTEKEMKRIEITLNRLRSGASESSNGGSGVVSPASSTINLPSIPASLGSRQLQHASLGQESPSRPMLGPKSALRSSATGSRVTSGPSRLSSSSSVGSNLSATPPAPPAKSRLRRISATAESLGLQTQPISTPPRASSRIIETPKSLRTQRSMQFGSSAISQTREGLLPKHNRSNSTAFPEASSWAKTRVGSSPPDTRSAFNSPAKPVSPAGRGQLEICNGLADLGTLSRAPPSSFRSTWLGLEGVTKSRSKTPQPQPSWSRSGQREGSTPQMPAQSQQASSRAASVTGSSTPGRPLRSSVFDTGDESIEVINSTYEHPARPSSSAGLYYRPPSAQGNVGDDKLRKRSSMIPRLAFNGDSGSSPARPGSAMSQASSGSYMGGVQQTPPRYGAGASRLVMQTPEPTIMARAQRLSMYARAPSTGVAGMGTPSSAAKRSSRPPPTRLNASLMSSRSASSGAGGRTTPLSAAALAAIPTAEPGSSLTRSSGPTNLRAGPRPGLSGRATPTFSESGSIGGRSNATWAGGYGQRMASGSIAGSDAGRGMYIEAYKPNPNDALDVQVAAIANGLGVSLERIDPHLPRGVKLEEGPGKDNRAKYEVGGKLVVCRLLELHRPAGSAGARAGTKAKKILVRVGGGWQDLEQWLLNMLREQ